MSRSLWKGPFVDKNLMSELRFQKKFKTLKTKSRNSSITPLFVGKTIEIHNGKIFHKITVTEEMVGHKLGEFSPTRKTFFYKKGK